MTMKILSIEAENIKRLRAVRVNLGGGHLTVVGRPDQGKTTAIDLVWFALQTRAIGPEVISHGADEATISVVLGEPGKTFTVTRRLKRDGDRGGSLKVKSSDGGSFGAKFLDTLVSDLTFDPTEFARAEGKAQVDMLLRVVRLPDGVSIEALDQDRAKVYAQRTDANRDLERARAKLPAEAPAAVEEVSVAEVLAAIEKELAAAQASNAANKEKRERLASYKAEVAKIDARTAEIDAAIQKLQDERAAGLARRAQYEPAIAKGEGIVAALVDVDLAPINEKKNNAIQDAEKVNKAARAYQDYVKAKAEVEALEKVPAELTARIADIDAKKKALLDSVAWPVPGLGIRDGAVTYGETLLSQCGTSVRMRVSCAIAMAMNPKLNTIRIDEGESLGKEGREELLRWAAEKDFQVLMTVVKDGPAEAGELEIIDDTLSNVPDTEEARAAAMVGEAA